MKKVYIISIIGVSMYLTSFANTKVNYDYPIKPIKAEYPLSITMPTLKLHPSPRYWERYRTFQGIPAIERTDGGTLWASWYAGPSSEGHEGNFIVLVASLDDGKTWTKPVAVCDCTTYFDAGTWDPRLWKSPDGSLLFSITRTMRKNSDGNDVTAWTFKAKNPDDPYTEWEDPTFTCFGITLNKPTVLSNGDVIMPIDDRMDPDNIAWAISKDKGMSFAPHSRLKIQKELENKLGCEHMLIERKDGSLLMMMRTEKGIATLESNDMGKTWNNFMLFSDQMSKNTRFYFGKLKSGNTILVLNDDPKSRNNMTVMMSEDDGKTWPYKLVIDERSAVSYPDATEANNGFIYITYDRGRYNKDQQEILFAKITENEIKEGKLTNPESSLKNIISKLKPFGGGVTRNFEPIDYEKEHKALILKINETNNQAQ